MLTSGLVKTKCTLLLAEDPQRAADRMQLLMKLKQVEEALEHVDSFNQLYPQTA